MQRRGEFRVSVSKDYLVFASAHFITFAGHRCEGLHGHNYRARVTIEGALDEESWFVFDFVTLKRLVGGTVNVFVKDGLSSRRNLTVTSAGSLPGFASRM